MKALAAVLALVLGLTPVAEAGMAAARPVSVPRASMPAVLPGRVVPSLGRGLTLSAPSLSPAPAPSLQAAVPAPLAPAAVLPAPAAAPLLPAGAAPAAAAPRAALSPLAALAAAAADAPKTPERQGASEEDGAKPASPEQQGAQAGRAFDGSAAREGMKDQDDAVVAPPPADGLARFGLRRLLPSLARRKAANAPSYKKSSDEEDTLNELGLFYAGTSARGLLDSHIWGDVKLIKPTEGSKWWWNKFKKGEDIRIKAGSEWLFYSKITDSATKPIGKLTKKDLAGIFSNADLARHGIAELRAAVIDKLTKAHRDQFQVKLTTPVRLIHFKTPKQLNADAEAGKPKSEIYDPFAERAPLKLPEGSPLRRLNEYFPKAVMVDLDAFGERIPPQLVEDMGKLQRAGVKFVFFSDRAGAEYKAQSAQIRDGLYGSLFATDGGALIVANSRDQSHTRTADLLTAYDRETLLSHAKAVAYELGGGASGVAEVPVAAPGGLKSPARTYFNGRVPASVDAETFRASLQARLGAFGLRGEVELLPAGKGASRGFIIRHRRMTESMGDVLRGLQSMGVYANPQEILVISENPAYARALTEATRRIVAEDQPGTLREGAVAPAPDAATLAGVPLKGHELVENALGAVLGEYRQNRRNDFVTSASALESFSHYTDRFFSQELIKGEENVYAFWGHESHDVMNWVAWVHRNTGKAPSEEEMVARFRRQWDEAVHSSEFAVYLPPGRDLINIREAAVGRLKGMYQVYRRVMDIPGIRLVGTEVPNVFMLRHFDRKTGETRRVFIRTIFDFAAVVPTEDGSGWTLMMMDFKSGVKPTEEVLRKKIQPRTYRLFTAYKWAELPAEYAVAGGALTPVKAVELEFIYNRSAVPIHLHGWNDSQTELEILRVAERMRQDKQRTHLRPKRRTRAAKPGAAKPAPKRAAKKPAAKKPGAK